MIRATGFDVSGLQRQLEAAPELWNQHRERTEMYGTPHGDVSDIWVRYNDWKNYTGDWKAFHEQHDSVWYPAVSRIPAAWSLYATTRKHSKMKTLANEAPNYVAQVK